MKKRTIKKIIVIILLVLLASLPSLVFAATQTAEVSAPDLPLNSSDIFFSPENPVMGQPVNITVIVHNIGGCAAKNVTANFYVDGTSIIRKEIDEVPPDSQKSVSINYIFLSAGYHNITIKVNASNTQKEVQASKTIYVSSPTPSRGGGGGALLYFTPTPTPAPAPAPPLPSLIISNVTVTIEADSVFISWDTNEKSDSQVKCGMKSGHYTIEEYAPQYVLHHAIPVKQISLKNIFENTTYYFIVNSTDPSGNSAQTDEYMFILTPPEREGELMPFILQLPLAVYPHMWWILLVIFIVLIIILLTLPGRKSRRTFNSLTEKPVGTEVLMYLFSIFPKVSRPVDIAKQIRVDLNGVLEGLHTLSNKNRFDSLFGIGLVDKVECKGEACYRISKRGKSLITSLK